MSKIIVTVSGETGSGKSAIAGEIEIALKAIGVPVVWQSADREHWTHGNEYWIDLYKPEVTICERNKPLPASGDTVGEALRHADIDLSMLLPEIANAEMRASVRNTLDMIDTARGNRAWRCAKCSGTVLHAGKPNFCPYCRSADLREG